MQTVLSSVVTAARTLTGGACATYIPELRSADPETLGAAITPVDGPTLSAGDTTRFTLQSAAKLIVLCGLLEERGLEAVLDVVDMEPSGRGFASVTSLESRARPANPLVNAGAIALCGQLSGNLEDRLAWIEDWAARLLGERLVVNTRVMASERRTGDRNRAIAYLLQSAGVMPDATSTLEVYFTLCSLEADVRLASQLPALLARSGRDAQGRQVLSPETAAQVVAVMATCGMYDESGRYLMHTGMPAKSGVSGVIVAVANKRAGVAVYSPRVNDRGSSVRGLFLLERLSRECGWHFAAG